MFPSKNKVIIINVKCSLLSLKHFYIYVHDHSLFLHTFCNLSSYHILYLLLSDILYFIDKSTGHKIVDDNKTYTYASQHSDDLNRRRPVCQV